MAIKSYLRRIKNSFVQLTTEEEIELRKTLEEYHELVSEGLPDDHAQITVAVNVAIHIGSALLSDPVLGLVCSFIVKAQDMYMPSWPPVSPVSTSFFGIWAFCDNRIERTKETPASLIVASLSNYSIPKQYRRLVKQVLSSRLGVYKVITVSESTGVPTVEIEELATSTRMMYQCRTNHRPTEGDLLLLRLCPSPKGEYSVSLMSPYTLDGTTEDHWLQFFQRYQVYMDEPALSKFMRFGSDSVNWIEFVMQGYAGHTQDTISLHGVPDLPESLLHSASFCANWA